MKARGEPPRQLRACIECRHARLKEKKEGDPQTAQCDVTGKLTVARSRRVCRAFEDKETGRAAIFGLGATF